MIPDEDIEFFNLCNPFSCTMGPGVYSASKRNEYETVFLGNIVRLAVRLTTSLPSISQLSR
jgi:hypothetical protein